MVDIMHRGTVEDDFYSDEETADVGLDIDENLLGEEDLEVVNTNSEFDQQSKGDLEMWNPQMMSTFSHHLSDYNPSALSNQGQPTLPWNQLSQITWNQCTDQIPATLPLQLTGHLMKSHILGQENCQSMNRSFLQLSRQDHLQKLRSNVYKSLVPCI